MPMMLLKNKNVSIELRAQRRIFFPPENFPQENRNTYVRSRSAD